MTLFEGKVKILENIEKGFITPYKEGSRFGKALLRKSAANLYEVYVKWDYPRQTKTTLFQGSLKKCITFFNAKFRRYTTSKTITTPDEKNNLTIIRHLGK
jgi:hypothetical protein